MIAIVDYKAGNLTSVELAVRHVGGDCVVTEDPAVVAQAERVIFPGVGAAASCMKNLRARKLAGALTESVHAGNPVLAICVGLQLAFEHSAEDGGVACLGLLKGMVERFDFPAQRHVKVPHMGWNGIDICRPHPLLAQLPAAAECYFVHSYYAQPENAEDTICTTEYEGVRFTAAAGRGNLFATQFHPEKSGEIGLQILRNFLVWDGSP